MSVTALTTLVVAYDDVDIALYDLAELDRAASAPERKAQYQAAVVRVRDDGLELVSTTVAERSQATILGLGLGFVAGVLISPALPPAIVGAGLGGVVGDLVDQASAFKHADMAEVAKLLDGSAASLVVISDEAMHAELRRAAVWRHRRVVVPVDPADVETLERELQRFHRRF